MLVSQLKDFFSNENGIKNCSRNKPLHARPFVPIANAHAAQIFNKADHHCLERRLAWLHSHNDVGIFKTDDLLSLRNWEALVRYLAGR